VAETSPSVARKPRPPGFASAKTTEPVNRLGSLATSTGSMSPVSTAMTARSLSASTPATSPDSTRPSANVTDTSSPRRLCAFVTTRPAATTTPDPRPQPRPRPTTAGPTRSTTALTDPVTSSSTAIPASSVYSHYRIASHYT